MITITIRRVDGELIIHVGTTWGKAETLIIEDKPQEEAHTFMRILQGYHAEGAIEKLFAKLPDED